MFTDADFAIHSGQPKSGPWLLGATEETTRYFQAVQMPSGWTGRPGEPLVGPRGPHSASTDPRDPMAKLPAAGMDYDTMVNNLVSHYHGSNDDEKKQGRLWYRVAHSLFGKMGEDAGVGHDRAVAVGSATSPNTDWNENIKHAGNMLMHYRPSDPGHNENDWMMAHIHPQARADFQAQAGRDPTHSDEDLHALADMHAPYFARGKSRDAVNDLANPEARSNWMTNIQHHGMDAVLGDHEKQVFDNRRKTDAQGNVIGYQPQDAMRHIMRRDLGSGTLSSNVKKAKDIIRAQRTDPGEFNRILGGPKTGNFSSNILDPTPMDDEGYLAHPNGDWTQHEDLGGTIDAHHLRASTMAHGQWQRKGYRDKGSKLNPSDPYTYDVFNRGLLDATHQVNSTIADPSKHITPKQLQAIIWLKHKNDNDRFKKLPINHESEITPDMLSPDYVRPKAPARAAAIDSQSFAEMPPLWRKMFMSRVMPEWTDLLGAWVDHNSTADPLQGHEQQRMGPHPRQGSWYIDAAQWLDGPHTSQAETDDGQQLKVRHPWEENPHFEWQHYHDQGRPVTGIASSLPEAKAQAEQSHKDLSGAWDPDAEQDALDPRLLGASKWYTAADEGMSDEEKHKKLEDLGLFSDEANEFYDKQHNAPENWKSKYLSDPAFMENEYQHSTTPPDRFDDNTQWQSAYNWDRTKPEFKEKLRQDSLSRDPGAYHPWPVDQQSQDETWGPHSKSVFWESPEDVTDSLKESVPFQVPKHLMPQLRTNSQIFARQYFADTDGLDMPLDSGEGRKKKKDPDVEAGSPIAGGTPTGLSEGAMPDLPAPGSVKGPGQYVHVGPMGGGGMPSGGMGGGSGTPVSYTPSSGVEQWRSDVDLGLQRQGLPTSLDSQVLKQMQTESSGNPNAINNSDSNAVAGHPSQGLLQTIPSTFNTYHLPGDSTNIDDPQANIDSAIGYAKGTYGPSLMNSQGMGMGSGHGY